MENSAYLLQLLEKYRDNSCSPDEVKQLLAYFRKDSQEQEQLMELVLARLQEEPTAAELDSHKLDSIIDEAYGRIQQQIHSPRQKVRRLHWGRVAAAAAILIFLSVGIYWYRQDDPAQTRLTSQYGGDVLPGGNRAVLTLADGSTIDLDSVANGLLAEQQGILITKNEDGTITYEVAADGLDGGTAAFNTIATPHGGQYNVVLPDGSRVWLNAESSLRYPVAFHGDRREVALTGEGFFEVAHRSAQPFSVLVGGHAVEVLGTHFNVNAYGDTHELAATLVEGSVRVVGEGAAQSAILKPGQQARLTAKGIKVVPVDVGDYTAWKDGLMILNSDDLPTIFRQLERWYDVEFISREPLKATVSGIIPRQANLSEVLRAIENNTGVKFRIEERRVLVINE